jgi:hypothetical protein
MKTEVKNLCNKINNELEKVPTSTTLLLLIENLNAKAIKQLVLNASHVAEHRPSDPTYHSELIEAISLILKLSDTIVIQNIINTLNEDRINLLEKLLDNRRKAIILYAFIKIRNDLIKHYNATGDEFNTYDIGNKFDDICNAYISDPKYNTPEHTWQDLDMLTTEPIFDINEHTFGRNGKFKKIFDNIDDIIKRTKK